MAAPLDRCFKLEEVGVKLTGAGVGGDMFNRTKRYGVLVLMGLLPAAAVAGDPIVPNEIINTMLCPGEGDYCYWPELAAVPETLDRVIWDGSFTTLASTAAGPGGRWFGNAGSNEDFADPQWRSVKTDADNNGYLMLAAWPGPPSAWVHGQTFGQTADGPVILEGCDVISLTFRAHVLNHDCQQRSWTRVQLVDCSGDASSYELIDDQILNQDFEFFYVEVTDSDWIDCRLELMVNNESLPLDVTNWAPIVTFGIEPDAIGSDIEFHIDDIEINLARKGASPRLNLLDQSSAEQCHGPMGTEITWTFMTDGHYLGGGEDSTSALATGSLHDKADVNHDCAVNVLDLLAVIEDWTQDTGSGDVNCDGDSNILDLLEVIGDWGWTCP